MDMTNDEDHELDVTSDEGRATYLTVEGAVREYVRAGRHLYPRDSVPPHDPHRLVDPDNGQMVKTPTEIGDELARELTLDMDLDSARDLVIAALIVLSDKPLTDFTKH